MSTPIQWITWPHNGTVYLEQKLCPVPQIPIVDQSGNLIDFTVMDYQGGQLVPDPAKVQAKQAAELKAVTDEISARTKYQSFKTMDPIKSTDSELRQIVKDILDYMIAR